MFIMLCVDNINGDTVMDFKTIPSFNLPNLKPPKIEDVLIDKDEIKSILYLTIHSGSKTNSSIEEKHTIDTFA